MDEKILFRNIPMRLLFVIGKKGSKQNMNLMVRRNNFPYPHSIKILKIFLENGLVVREKVKGDKRAYHLFLTEKGKEVVNHYKEIKQLLTS